MSKFHRDLKIYNVLNNKSQIKFLNYYVYDAYGLCAITLSISRMTDVSSSAITDSKADFRLLFTLTEWNIWKQIINIKS